MKAYVGADWSATEVACAMAVGDGPVRRLKAARRSFPSVKALVDGVRERDQVTEVAVVIEAGARGWAELFHQAGASVFVVDPKQAKAFAASMCSSGAKDDARDAENLVGMLRGQQHRLRAWAPKDDLSAQLDELGSMHEALSQDVRRAEQRLRRATDPRARANCDLLGRQAALQLGWAKRMYADARRRGQNAATAYRRIARSLLRILTPKPTASGPRVARARTAANASQPGRATRTTPPARAPKRRGPPSTAPTSHRGQPPTGARPQHERGHGRP